MATGTPERIADRREAKHNVQVRLCAVHKIGPELRWRLQTEASPGAGSAAGLEDAGALVIGEQARHFASVQEVVEILDERFALELRV